MRSRRFLLWLQVVVPTGYPPSGKVVQSTRQRLARFLLRFPGRITCGAIRFQPAAWYLPVANTRSVADPARLRYLLCCWVGPRHKRFFARRKPVQP
ncbi:Uncharacterised protein [Mycobacteroides abscessus]|nr:Uncharacterised protein [Mycobacteroides abscessus]